MRIGELLIAEGLATPEHIDAALRSQVVHGGRLGTNLVEQFRFPLDQLAEALGRQRDMPAATQRHFERCDAQVQGLLDPAIAAEWHTIPMGRLPDGSIAVAVTDPLPDEGLDILQFALGAAVVPAIAPELRVLYYLEQVYGVPRLNRFLRTRPADRDQHDDRRRYVQTLSESVPSAPSQLARVAIRKIRVPSSDVFDLPVEIDSVAAGVRVMRQCTSRSRLAHAVVKTAEIALCPPLTGLILMTLRDGVVSGWKGVVPGGNTSVIESIAFEIDSQPVVRQAVESATLAKARPLNDAAGEHLWSALQVPPPGELIAAASRMNDKPVALLFAFADQPARDEILDGVEELAGSLGRNFERLLRAAER
jgi:hypothetical protein